MPPKTYARVLRLNAAVAGKTANPRMSWAEIAQDFGYLDQAHLAKGFLDLKRPIARLKRSTTSRLS
jgi:hypothetical protein